MVRWSILVIFLIVWTVGVEMPFPDPGHMPGGEFIFSYKIIVAKSVHVAVYALLTVMSAWVPMPTRFRWLMMFLLMLHAWGTEMLQKVLEEYCHREGDLRDIGYDVIGIVIGVIMSWNWWTKEND